MPPACEVGGNVRGHAWLKNLNAKLARLAFAIARRRRLTDPPEP